MCKIIQLTGISKFIYLLLFISSYRMTLLSEPIVRLLNHLSLRLGIHLLQNVHWLFTQGCLKVD
jgi:hypothetical protein